MAITFRVNLSTVDLLQNKQPYSSNDPHGTSFPATRSTWFPNFLRDNRELHHGATFVASGKEALDLLNNYTNPTTFPAFFTSSLKSYNVNAPADFKFLDYVSGTVD